METALLFSSDRTSHRVSEELNSVETFSTGTAVIEIVLVFQKNLIVWKLRLAFSFAPSTREVSEELSSVETKVYIQNLENSSQVSEELNSVETVIAPQKCVVVFQ